MAQMLLRSPPFVHVDPGTAAVAHAKGRAEAQQISGEAIDEGALDRALARMATARVGGDFWGSTDRLPPDIRGWCHVESHRDAHALIARNSSADTTAVTIAGNPGLAGAARRLRRAGYLVLDGPTDPWGLLDQVAAVVVAGDPGEAAILALAAGRPWHDLEGTPLPSADDVRAAAYQRLIHGVRYRDPFDNGATIDVTEAIDVLGFWREHLARNRGLASACAMAPWKRRNVRQMLWDGSTQLRFRTTSRSAVAIARRANGKVAAWAPKAPADLGRRAEQAHVPIVHVEDGFIRSIGLGSDCVPPQSIVADSQRPHYDPSGPSDLETMIETFDVPPQMLAEARRVIDRINAAGLGKYGGKAGAAVRRTAGKDRTVLVTGQVENDASVRLGGADVAGNLDLLRRVRAMEPDATIIYRPHPDVEAAHRVGAIDKSDALRFADTIDADSPLSAAIDGVDAVHVLTSLTGFEALLRGRAVFTHGAPFYSGWGLTNDCAPTIARRTRRVSLETLFACTVLYYPRYLDPRTELPCPANVLVDRLVNDEGHSVSVLTRFRRLRRLPIIRQVVGE